ncbi:MAG TPA: NADH-quinone oxidoreductase subunit K, partial [Planctomycetota bacterium]|nr:NADH-quinone oxidoreductase subunit K [Planctomycetota bacterium]
VNLVGFSRFSGGLDAQVFALFVIVLAAAEAAVALAIILQLFDKRTDVDVDRASSLRG